MKVPINPVSYRLGKGINLEIVDSRGFPPIAFTWEISTATGFVLERGENAIDQEDWDNWPVGDDNYYAERCLARQLAVTLVEK